MELHITNIYTCTCPPTADVVDQSGDWWGTFEVVYRNGRWGLVGEGADDIDDAHALVSEYLKAAHSPMDEWYALRAACESDV